jgi:hypothetical protein
MPGLADEPEEIPDVAAELAELPRLAQSPELLPEPGTEWAHSEPMTLADVRALAAAG